MSKDVEDTLKKAEETIENFKKNAEDRMENAEIKIQKGIKKTVIWIIATAVIYFIWGTTWSFWVSFVISFISVLGIIFVKLMLVKTHKSIAEMEERSYDLGSLISNEDDEQTMNIETDLFGTLTYVSDEHLGIDEVTMIFNEKEVTFHGMIFDNLTEAQIENTIPLLDNLEKLDEKAKEKWLALFREEDEVVIDFINEHFNQYGDEIRNEIFNKLNINKQDNRLFLENLEFGAFHITEGDEEDSVEIVMDYSLIWQDGISFTDQILAMSFTDNLVYENHSHDS